MANEVKTTLSADIEKLISNLREIQGGYGKINTSIQQADKSIEELNKDLSDQKVIIKEIEEEERRLAALQKKGGKDYSDQLKRVRSDLEVAKNEQKGLTDQIKKTTQAQKEAVKQADLGSKAFKKLGGIIAVAFSVHTLIRYGKEAFKLYQEQQIEERKLLTALNNRADIQKRLIQQANELQRKTIFSNTDTINAQALLATFGLTEKQITTLIPLIQDMSTALGLDFVEATRLVGKSVSSNTDALTRYFVTGLEGVNGATERAIVLTETLTEKFEGQAEQVGDLNVASIVKLKNAWDDFLKLMGKSESSTLGNIFAGLTKLLEKNNAAWEKYYADREENTKTYDEKLAELSKESLETLLMQQQKYADVSFKRWESEKKKGNDANAKQYAGQYVMYLDHTEKIKARLEFINEEEKKIQDKADAEKIEADRLAQEKLLKQIKKAEEERLRILKEAAEEAERIRQQSISESLAYLDAREAGLNFFSQVEKDKFQEEADLINQQNEAYQRGAEFFAQIEKDKKDDADKTLQFERDLSQARLDVAATLASGLADIVRASAGNQEEYANFVKLINEVEIIANGALAISNALATTTAPTIDNIATGGLSGLIKFAKISGVILSSITASIINLKSTKVPAFAEGTPFVDGKGTETSDSIIARLSKGERVVTAKDNSNYWDALEAMRKGNFEREYFDKDAVIKIAKAYELAEKEDFANRIASGFDFMRDLNNHEDLINIRRKLGDSNYWLKLVAENTKNQNKERMR